MDSTHWWSYKRPAAADDDDDADDAIANADVGFS